MSQGWKNVVIVLAAALIASTPLVWLLGGQTNGQFVGICVQATVGVLTLVWALLQRPANGPGDKVVSSGKSDAKSGGKATSGLKRPKGRGRGSAEVRNSGPATSTGEGSQATSGIAYS